MYSLSAYINYDIIYCTYYNKLFLCSNTTIILSDAMTLSPIYYGTSTVAACFRSTQLRIIYHNRSIIYNRSITNDDYFTVCSIFSPVGWPIISFSLNPPNSFAQFLQQASQTVASGLSILPFASLIPPAVK